MPGACAGLRVVEISRGMAGSLAGMILADHGADVVRLESPRGDPNLSLVGERVWSRGKIRVALDLDVEEQRGRAVDILRQGEVGVIGPHPVAADEEIIKDECAAAPCVNGGVCTEIVVEIVAAA